MAGTWHSLEHQPQFSASTMLLLTNGAVMCQQENTKFWWKLTPDASGNYQNGTWSPLAPMHDARLYYASAVMADGRVFVAGGEYSGSNTVVDLAKAEIYNPVTNSWTSIPIPTGWTSIGDASCCMLSDGRILLGSITDAQTTIYDPATNTWHATGNALDKTNEETWTLMRDHSVLSVECSGHPKAEKYIPSLGGWVSANATPVDLVEAASIEIGPALLLPDGRVFAIGATGNTALYTAPVVPAQPGTWKAGPKFPKDGQGRQFGAKDAPACLLTNGNVLCAVGPVTGNANDFLSPTSFFEFDPVAINLTPAPTPGNAGGPPFEGRMLLLPSGEVLFTAGSNQVYLYQSVGAPHSAWRPTITNFPHTIFGGSSYTLQGRQLNGLSQANSYGDDATMATNYPLIRLREPATNKVHYCRTFGHSSMGVATGASIQSTHFQVPIGIPAGWLDMSVVANGIASQEVRVSYAPKPVAEMLADIHAEIGQLGELPVAVFGNYSLTAISAEDTGDAVATGIGQDAQKAREAILNGLQMLLTLGQKLEAHLADTSIHTPSISVKLSTQDEMQQAVVVDRQPASNTAVKV